MNKEAMDALMRIVEIAVIPFGVYVVRSLSILASEIRSVKEALIGPDGKNGIRSRVEKLEHAVERIDRDLNRLIDQQDMRHGDNHER